MTLRYALFRQDLPPHIKNGVDRKAATARRRIDHIFLGGGVQHTDAHINDVTGSKVLSLFPFLAFAHEILEGIVNHVEIGIKKFYVLKAGHANGKMGAVQGNFLVGRKYPLPSFFGVIEQWLNFVRQFRFRITVIAELQIPFLVASALKFVVQLGENQFENFLEHIHPRIGQHFVLHFKDKSFEGFSLRNELIFLHEGVYRPTLRQNVRQGFVGAGNAR